LNKPVPTAQFILAYGFSHRNLINPELRSERTFYKKTEMNTINKYRSPLLVKEQIAVIIDKY